MSAVFLSFFFLMAFHKYCCCRAVKLRSSTVGKIVLLQFLIYFFFPEKYLEKQITASVEQQRVLQGNQRWDQRVLCLSLFLWNVLYVYPSFS